MVKKKVVKKRVVKKAKRKGQVILPRKMSSLIRIALKDIRKAEASPKFVIHMGNWYLPDRELVCAVGGNEVSRQKVCVACAAGSVMAFSLGLGSESKDTIAHELLRKSLNSNQLQAINSLRTGSVLEAANDLNLVKWPAKDRSNNSDRFEAFVTEIPEYAVGNPEPFHEAMGKLQAKLRKAGL